MTLIRQQQRRGTAAFWAAVNPVLAAGEIGFISDNPPAFKIGDGLTPWLDLDQSAISIADLQGFLDAAEEQADAAHQSAVEAQQYRDDAVSVADLDVTDEAVAALFTTSAGERTLPGLSPVLRAQGALGSKLLGLLAESKTRVVRAMTCGTSIGTFGVSPNQMLMGQLSRVYGYSGTAVETAGVAGGSYENPYYGWKKQAYGGRQLVRLRGENASQTLLYVAPGIGFDRCTVEFSREPNGASAVPIKVNGVVVATIDCSGPQSLGNRVTFSVPDTAALTLTVDPPAAGVFVYLEAIRWHRADAVGFEHDDFTLGGSALVQLAPGSVSLGSLGQKAPPIPNDGYAALDSFFARDDFDLIVCTYTVNDAGSLGTHQDFLDRWVPLAQRALAKTRDNGTELLWVIEMGGHYSLAADGGPNGENGYARFNDIRDWLIAAARDNTHLTVFDWDGLTRIPGDPKKYQTTYYPGVTNFNPPYTTSAGTSGDFIHPAQPGYEAGSAGLFGMLGLTPADSTDIGSLVASGLSERWQARQSATGTRPFQATSTTDDGVTVRLGAPVALAHALGERFDLAGRDLVPVYADRRVESADYELGGLAILRAGGDGSDAFGPFVRADATVNQGNGYVFSVVPHPVPGQLVTVVLMTRGDVRVRTNNNDQGGLLHTADGVPVYQEGPSGTNGAVNAIGTVADPRRLQLHVFKVRAYGSALVRLSIRADVGGVYGLWACHTDRPVLAETAYGQYAGPGPAAYMVGDRPFTRVQVGQTYVEALTGYPGGGVVRKRLVGYAQRRGTPADPLLCGVYECLDRAAAGVQEARIVNGTGQVVSGDFPRINGVGGTGDRWAANDNGPAWQFNLPLPAPGDPAVGNIYTLTLPGVSTFGSFTVSFYNGGTNGQIYYNPATASWGAQSVGIAGPKQGTPVAVTFPLPAQDTPSNAGPIGQPNFLNVFLGGPFLTPGDQIAFPTVVLAKGSSALI